MALSIALTVPQLTFAQEGSDAKNSESNRPLDEIVVTAQKREENVQNVPISISVLDGTQLARIGGNQLTDYGNYVPGMVITGSGIPGQSTITLRGIAPLGASATVGAYIDDTPVGPSGLYSRSINYELDLMPYDIERIEVLRGPQGTLYGASSIGGLLKYVTVQPSLDKLSGKLGAGAFSIAHGNDTGEIVQGQINAPIVPGTLGLLASVAYRKTPGFVDGVVTGKRDQNSYDQYGAHVSMLWQPNDDFSVRLAALLQSMSADGSTSVVSDPVTGERIGDGYANNNYIDEPFDHKLYYYSLTLDYDLGFAHLLSASSYSRSNQDQTSDYTRVYGAAYPLFGQPAGLAPFTLDLDTDKFTEEVRLTSPSSERFEWLVGAFYTHEKNSNLQEINSYQFDGTLIAALDPLAKIQHPTSYREYAVFGDATYKFGSAFDITGGMRWARNSQDYGNITSGALVPTADTPGASSESVTTFSFSPRLHLTPTSMIYGRVASGYRPGGPNVNLPGIPPRIDSETLVDYELGLKSTLFDRRVTIDSALYRMDWKDLQTGVAINGIGALVNSGSATSKGVEASVDWWPTDELNFRINGAYTDAKLDSDGSALAGIPKWTASLMSSYSLDVNSEITARVGGGLRYTAERLNGIRTSATTQVLSPYTAVDLNAELAIGKRWTVRLYALNVGDKQGDTGRDLASDVLGGTCCIRETLIQPRTIGLTVDLAM